MLRQRDVYRGDRTVAYQDRVTAANYEAMITYSPKEYGEPIHLLIASERSTDPGNKTRLAWASFAKGGFSVFRIKAKDSGELLRPPHVTQVAEILRGVLGDEDRTTSVAALKKGLCEGARDDLERAVRRFPQCGGCQRLVHSVVDGTQAPAAVRRVSERRRDRAQ